MKKEDTEGASAGQRVQDETNTGGYQSEGDNTNSMNYKEFQATQARAEKTGIAIYVAGQIPKCCAVFLDAGSTVEFVAREIFRRETADNLQSLTIMTNNMAIFNSFNKPEEGGPRDGHSLSLLLTGGHYDKNHDALFGTQAAEALKAFYPRVVVMGTSGFTVDQGLFVFGHTAEQVIKKEVYSRPTDHRIIVCDYRKIGRTDSFLCGKFDELMNNTHRCTIVTSVVPDSIPAAAALDRHIREMLEDDLTRLRKLMETVRKAVGACYKKYRSENQGKDCGVLQLVQVDTQGNAVQFSEI